MTTNMVKKDTPAAAMDVDRIIAITTAVAIKGEPIEKSISR